MVFSKVPVSSSELSQAFKETTLAMERFNDTRERFMDLILNPALSNYIICQLSGLFQLSSSTFNIHYTFKCYF